MIIASVYLFVLGAALGSFSLVLAWRMHDKKDWIKGRSKCDHCGHLLHAKDIVPILSWVSLRGKCRYCKKKLSSQLILAELFLGLVFAMSWWFWPYESNNITGYLLFGLWLFICTVMSALFWYDLRWFILPSKLVYTLLGLGVVFALIRPQVIDLSLVDAYIYPVLGATLLSGFFALLYFASNGKWIGFGDVRLALPLGLLVGSPLNVWMMLFVASVIGVMVALPALVNGQKKLTAKIPFGPLLIIATILSVLFMSDTIIWYSSNFGL
jgi:prepilin signal peptidase PulO-like enzyme (type II secretory pathway)